MMDMTSIDDIAEIVPEVVVMTFASRLKYQSSGRIFNASSTAFSTISDDDDDEDVVDRSPMIALFIILMSILSD